jgi:FtsP/CotA-like multicopper oxidase with cupredoxin domain
VNGTAYPYVTLPPIAVRFRVLNACNDRTLNLQLYYAATASGVPCDGATLDPATGALPPQGACTEVSMVPAIPRAAYPTWPSDGREGGVPDPARAGPDLIQIGNESGFLVQPAVWRSQPVDFDYNRRSVTFGGVTSHALLLMSGVRADVVVDLSSAAPGATLILYNDAPAPMPLFDSRNDYFTDDPDRSAVGGAPRTAPGFGPNTRTLLQIRIDPAGTPAAPYDVTALTAAMARAYGIDQDPPLVPQTVYNAAFPGIAATTVYAKGWDEALNVSGTTQSVAMVVTTVPGVGYATPPTVVFSGGGGAGAAATAALNGVTAITLVTAGSGYTSAPTVTIGAPGAGGIQATAAATVSGGVVTSIVVVNPGSNYTVAPAVTLAGGGGAGATATASIVLGSVGAITLTNTGSGYTSAPLVTLTGGGGTGAAAAAMLAGSIVMDGKNMVEGFDMMFGRMNAVLGSTPNPLTPTVGAGPVIGPMFYVDPPTELLKSGQTVLWRLTHVGVDSHAMHFHLLNVQVVNRVDWTNVIKPPYPDELGWKETIRTNPFEDIIVAIRPAAMTLPFAVPNSSRLLDPTTVAGSTANFTPAPPPPGFPQVAGITNVVTGFGWEYVWHCHLLGHEENDMMRPLVFQPTPPSASVAPAALAFGTVLVGTAAAPLVETVTNAAPAGSQSLVLSGITLTGANAADFTSTHTCAGGVGPLLSCAITVTFTPAAAGARRATLTLATNDPARPTVAIPLTGTGLVPPVAPTGLTAAIASATSATLSWRDASNNEAAFAIWRADNGGAAAQVGTVTRTAAQGTATGGLVTFTDAGLAAGNDYTYHVTATNAVGASPPSSTVTLAFAVPAAPTALAARVASATSAALSWTDASTSETSFAVWQSTNGGAFAQVATVTRTAAQGAATGGAVASTSAGLAAGSTYAFYVTAINALGASAPSATVSLTFAAPGAPTGFTGTVAAGATTDPLTLTWVAPTTGAGSYQIQRARNATFTTGLATTTVTGTLTTTTVNVAKGVSLYVRIRAVNAFGSSAWVNLTPFPIVTP